MEWQYSPVLDEDDLLSGKYAGFVYYFQFDDGSTYIGSKQLYKKVKSYRRIKSTSIENGWRDYSSSSKIVNEKIEQGVPYTKTILYAFPNMKETLLVETILIYSEGLKPYNLNLAVMHKGKLPTGKDRIRLYGIVQELLEWLN
ncbi:hypothetical protein [Kluyvera georgiana]|uniref:hypothetical protein n=1 Tax=Kluyvera georgiana TaxID=73098 RepID=UPI003AEFC12A